MGCDAKAMDDFFAQQKFDGVIHFAGLKAVGESVAKPIVLREQYQWDVEHSEGDGEGPVQRDCLLLVRNCV